MMNNEDVPGIVKMPMLNPDGMRRPMQSYVDQGDGAPRDMQDILAERSEQVDEYIVEVMKPAGIATAHEDLDQLAEACALWFRTKKYTEEVIYVVGEALYFSKRNINEVSSVGPSIEGIYADKANALGDNTYVRRGSPDGLRNAHLDSFPKLGKLFAQWCYPKIKEGAKIIRYRVGEGLDFTYSQ